MRPLVTVVMASHNAEEYIEECLKSILNQTLQQWECIIVNDGATDKTPSIIEQYVAKDPRFSLYSIPNTGSCKIPQDIAISYARADWIVGIAHDDFIDDNTLEKLYHRALESNADAVCLRTRGFNNSTHEQWYMVPSFDFPMDQIITGREAFLLTVPVWRISVNGTLFKREIWNSRTFYETNRADADEYDGREMLLNSKTVAFVDTKYHHRIHPESISFKPTMKQFDWLITDQLTEELIQKHFDQTQVQLWRPERFKNIINAEDFLCTSGHLFSKRERREGKKIIKTHFLGLDKKQIYKDSWKKRFLYAKWYFLFRFTIHHYKKIWSIICKLKLQKIYALIK